MDAELTAAGIFEPSLRADYQVCRELAREHGRTYFLATRFLPPERRPAVHALYGFARRADDIVDDPSPDVSVDAKTAGLQALLAQLRAPDRFADPTVRAATDAARRFDIDASLFEDFMESMQMDLTVTRYQTHDDLDRYVHGSAAVIGLMTLPILGTVVPVQEAAPFAADLGIAFQLTNFIRDVGEDLRLGRCYLPQESLQAFGVDVEHLTAGVVDAPIRRLLAHEIARTREIYRRAEPGIAMLSARARGCVRVAFQLYGDILVAVEQSGYQVFGPRIRVPRRRRAGIALRTVTGMTGAGLATSLTRVFPRERPAEPIGTAQG